MSLQDLITLLIYIVCIITVLNQIKESFNDEYTVTLDKDVLKEQLETYNLQDIVDVSFGFDKRYEFGKSDKLKQIGVTVKNKSKTHSVYVDWDQCAVTDLQGRSRRVTRLMPGTTLDLFQSQVFSTIAPETTLKEKVTAEDVLKRQEAKDNASVALEMDVAEPLINFEAFGKEKDNKKKYTRFLAHLETLDFSLTLALRLAGYTLANGKDFATVRCRFILTKLPWQAGLPWNPK